MRRYLSLSNQALQDIEFWLLNNPKIARKIIKLCREIIITPFVGSGKPEALKHDKHGSWSRRITREHRLVYFVDEEKVTVVSCKGHYE